jgi:hypothetical protein
MEWTISYIGVAIAVLFAALAGVALGIMYGLSVCESQKRRYSKILAAMEIEYVPGQSR